MARKKFTAGEMEQLGQSPYVLAVTQPQVHFSSEFKARFYQALMEGKEAQEITIELGIDPDILGVNRVNG